MATTGGNLMQRTRCYYFRDTAYACNKRQPGSGCAAIDGFNRIHAVLGGSDQCIATHPSDMAVALVCLYAVGDIKGSGGGERKVAAPAFPLFSREKPHKEKETEPRAPITAAHNPKSQLAAR